MRANALHATKFTGVDVIINDDQSSFVGCCANHTIIPDSPTLLEVIELVEDIRRRRHSLFVLQTVTIGRFGDWPKSSNCADAIDGAVDQKLPFNSTLNSALGKVR